MDYKIITNNNKVFNFFKETDNVIYLENHNINGATRFVMKSYDMLKVA